MDLFYLEYILCLFYLKLYLVLVFFIDIILLMSKSIQVFSIFNKFPNLKIDMYTKKSKAFEIKNKNIVSARQIHGNKIKKVSKNNKGKIIQNADGLMTNEKGITLSIRTADCLSIFIFDSKKNVIALLHAGWRGLESNIVGKSIKKLIKEFGSDAKDIVVGIGPGIGICHFEVKEDVKDKFKKYKNAIERKNERIFINLKQIALEQLLKEGIKEKNIEINPDCTYHENEKYYSFRRDKMIPLKTNLSVMGLV